MGNKVKVSPAFFLIAAMSILMIPLRWGAGVILAASVHEACHCIAVYLCGGQVLSVSLGAFGAKIEASPMIPGKKALCAIAGPVGSFSMGLAAEYFPEAALCGLIQGCYNLLPLPSLDGGELLRCLVPTAVCSGIRTFTLILLAGMGLWIATLQWEIGLFLLLSVGIPTVRRKLSCKEAG